MKSYLKEMLKRKDLLYYLVKSGLKAEHRNSYLGYFWWLLDPLLNVLVYYFLVVIVLERGGENYPLFLVIGLVAWRWISTTINASSRSILRYSSIVNQVALPKAIFPLSFTLTQLFNFMFGLIVIAIFLIIYGVIPTVHVFYLPLIIVIQLTAHIALGLVLGYITIFVRDIENLMTYITRIFFYASPIIWEGGRLLRSGKVPDWLVPFIEYNPVAILVESYRDILMHHQAPDLVALGVLFVISIVVIIYMLNYYSKNEHKIIKAL